MNYLVGTSLLCVALAGSVQAQSVTGAELNAGYTELTDGDLNTDGYTLGGSVEIGFARPFSLQGDLQYTQLDLFGSDGDLLGATGHLIYHANEISSFGFYYGRDSSDGEDVDHYGVEGGYGSGPLKASGYFGLAAIDLGSVDLAGVDPSLGDTDLGDLDLSQYGVSAQYAVSGRYAITGRFDKIAFNDLIELSRFGLGVEADVYTGISASAEVGLFNANLLGDGDDTPYLNVGATYTFGAERGTTFGSRSVAKTVFGF